MTLLGDGQSTLSTVLEPWFRISYRQAKRLYKDLSSARCPFPKSEYGKYPGVYFWVGEERVICMADDFLWRRGDIVISMIELRVYGVYTLQERHACEVFVRNTLKRYDIQGLSSISRFNWHTICDIDNQLPDRTSLWPRTVSL